MNTNQFDAMLRQLATHWSVHDMEAFAEEGLLDFDGRAVRIAWLEDLQIGELLVDLGPAPEAAAGNLWHRLLQHNYAGHAAQDGRAQFGVDADSGNIIGAVQFALDTDETEHAAAIIAELLSDAGAALALLVDPTAHPAPLGDDGSAGAPSLPTLPSLSAIPAAPGMLA